MDFLPGGTHVGARQSGPTITQLARRNHSPAFKAKVELAANKSERTMQQLMDQFDRHVSRITDWKSGDWGIPDKRAAPWPFSLPTSTVTARPRS